MAAPTFPKLNIFSQIKSESRGSSGGACEKCGSTLAFRVFSIFSLAFRAFILLSSVFRAMFSIWNSEPSSSSVWHSKPHLQFGVQSHHLFSVMTFRVVLLSLTFRDVSSSDWHSKPPLLLNYDVQSHLSQFGI